MTKRGLLLVGGGKMGAALLQGIATANLFDQIHAVDPAMPHADIAPLARWVTDATQLPGDLDPAVILIAIKPQMMDAAMSFYQRFPHSLFVSIAAGVTLARFAALLGPDVAVVRSMPNLPASIGAGATVAIANAGVTQDQRALTEKIFAPTGFFGWASDETQIDAVTALSGSGPAYVFALAEAMEAAGVKLGLAPELAAQLARQTLIGSGALLAAGGNTPAQLRQAVTSPKGTTAVALDILNAPDALPRLVNDSMQAAARRAIDLAGGK